MHERFLVHLRLCFVVSFVLRVPGLEEGVISSSKALGWTTGTLIWMLGAPGTPGKRTLKCSNHYSGPGAADSAFPLMQHLTVSERPRPHVLPGPPTPQVCRLPWDTPGTTTIPMFVDHGPSTSACPAEAPSGSTSAPLLASQPRKSSAPAMRDALAAEAGIPAMPAMSSFQRNSSAPPGRGDRSVAGPPVVPGPGGNMMEPVVGAASESVPVAQPAREERQMSMRPSPRKPLAAHFH